MAEKLILVPANDSNVNDAQKSLTDLAIMLPKTYRNKGYALLSCLDNHITLDDRFHVIYADEMGSHIVDLVRYSVTPAHLKLSRPSDAKKFYELLKQLGIPKSLYVQRFDVNAKWLTW